MNTGTTIIGIIIALICALPIILSALNNYKKKKKRLNVLNRIENEYNCKISRFDSCNNNSLIGFDGSSLLLFCIKWINDTETIQKIDLSEIQSCQVVNSTRAANKYNVVERIELVFRPNDRNKKEITVEFFNGKQDDVTLTDELQFVEKWCKLINSKIVALSNS